MKVKNPYNFPLSHIKYLRAVINYKRMLVPKGFKRTSSKRLQRLYNGVGAERWSPVLRATVTKALDILEAPAMIHDWEFSQRNKSFAKFTAANFRLLANSWKDRRFVAGLTAGVICEVFGYGAYRRG